MTNNNLTDDFKADGGSMSQGRIKEIADNAYGDEEKRHIARRLLMAEAELQQYREKYRWIKVSDEMPPNETTVLVRNKDHVQWVADVDHGEFYPDEFPLFRFDGNEITEWMRFPE